jgi:hypothetical protein
MKILLILLMACCLVASAQVVSGAEKIQSVGGDFGRTWLENLQAQNPEPTAQDSEGSLSSWGGAPKGNNITKPLDQDWLGVTTTLGNESNPKNNTTSEAAKKIPFTISKTFSPIHEIDASFNQTLQVPEFPQPDKNGLINGLPAETYYAIGPAFFDF